MSKEKVEKVLVDETGKPELVQIPVTTSKLVDSFAYCLASLMDVEVDDILDSVNEKIDALPAEQWFEPYREALNAHGYDTMCFSYSPPRLLETDLENYTFGEEESTKLPVGKCIIMGRSKDELNNQMTKCVVALINEHRNPVVLYDPYPDSQFVYFDNVIYFINTFLRNDESFSEED